MPEPNPHYRKVEEELREALKDLERARESERNLRLQTEGLLEGLRVLTRARNTAQMFDELTTVLRQFVPFESAFLIQAEEDSGAFQVTQSTSRNFEGSRWKAADMLRRVTTGEIIAVFDVAEVEEWRAQPVSVRERVCSAIHVPLRTGDSCAVLVFTHWRAACFDQRHVNLMEQFAPLTAQVMTSMEYHASLRAQNLRFDAAINNMSQGLCFFDGNQRLIVCNDLYASIYDLPRDLVRPGTTLNAIVGHRFALGSSSSDMSPAEYQRWREVIAKSPNPSDTEVRLKDGRTIAIHHQPMPDGGWVATHSDITARKQAEAAHVLLEAQLRESQKMEALGTLAGGIAHDFNNALAMIIGNVELARGDLGPDHEALVSLDEIAKASRRAKDLVQQILAFGRRQTLERKPMSLALVVVESARLIRATLPASVNLEVTCAADAPAVMADATQVNQILLNLCTNALHAVQDTERPGVIEIKLNALHLKENSVRGELAPGYYACLSVRDNGAGMDAATREHIFEPFFTTKPQGKGTGLGLSVVHGIVQAHEASVEVESTLGEGSTFRIYFHAVDPLIAELEPQSLTRTQEHGQGKHVLFIDDEEAILFLMKRTLERQGFRVSGNTDPAAAIAAVRIDPWQFDLVVTDYNMPGLNGLEVAKALREIRADLPVLLASGYITEELRAQAPAAGIQELIYKPNTVDTLCDTVARYAKAQGAKTDEGEVPKAVS